MTKGSEPVVTDVDAATNGSNATSAGAPAACPACGESLVAGARFCEACGAAANGSGAGAEGSQGATPPAQLVPTELDPTVELPAVVFGPCGKCGGAVDGDGYCTSCGHRALEDVAVDDRGTMAFATHRGRRHQRNEDSSALAGTSDGWPVLVVSDGVSVSPNPHLASAAAVAAAAERLAGRPFGGPDDLAAAVADADDAARAIPAEGDPLWTSDGSHPACTIVVAVATDSAVHVANVGDARAYLLRGGDGWRAAQISTDDSVAAHAVSQGVDAEVALNMPGGHGITAWLGADAHGLAPHVSTHPAAGGDLLLVCSDGLWNYAPTDQAMTDLVAATLPPPGTPTEPLAGLCERLVSWANDQGGADNISVALTPLPVPSGGADPAGSDRGDDHPTELEDNA